MAFDVKKGELPFLDRDTDSQTKTRITEANLCRSFKCLQIPRNGN